MADWAIARYDLNPARSIVCYPFTNLVYRKDSSNQKIIRRDLIEWEGRALVYSGALGEKQSPRALYDFILDCVRRNGGWKGYIFSEGPEFEQLKKLNASPDVVLKPLVRDEDLRDLLGASDIQLIPQAPGTSEGSLPSKLPNIAAVGTPILCITDPGSEISGLILEHGLGVVAESWDIKELRESFLRAAALPRGRSSRADGLIQKFDIKNLIDEMLA